jgi:LPS-assembly lipoprotein
MIRALTLSFVICTMVVWLSACGFTPMYGSIGEDDVNVSAVLSNVDIAPIPDREGQLLHNKLIDRFYKNGYPTAPTHQLVINPINETKRDLDITITSDTTRAQLTLSTTFKLIDSKTGETLVGHPVRSITSYNVLGGEFATRVTERNARDNAIEDVARQIERDVALFMKGR